MTSLLRLWTKQRTSCTVDCFYCKGRMDQTSALPFQLLQTERRFAESMWVSVDVVYIWASCLFMCVLCYAHRLYYFIASASRFLFVDFIRWLSGMASKTELLSISTWQQLESNLETCHSFLMRRHYKASFSPNLRHRVASLFLMTSDIFFCYLFSESDAMMCLWVGQLSGGPSLALVHVIRPYMEWHLAWPCGAPSGSSELICSQPRMPDIWSQTC